MYNKTMEKVKNNKLKIVYNIERVIIFATLTIVFFTKLKYSCLSNDDILDILFQDFFVDHGRFFTSLFKIILLREIPEFLNVHYQDFAIYSQSLFKSLFLTLIICSMTEFSVYFQKIKTKIIIYPFVSVLTFYLFFSIINSIRFQFGLEISQYFYGYVFGIPFFAAFWILTYKLFILNLKANKKTIILYLLLVIFLSNINEQYNLVSLCILTLIFLNKIRNKKSVKEIILALIAILITTILMYTCAGFKYIVTDLYGLNIKTTFNSTEIINFLYAYFDRVIASIDFLWIPFIFSILTLYCAERNKKFSKIIINYSILTNFSFLLFFLSLFLLDETFAYQNYEFYHKLPRYWVLHPGILASYYCFLIGNIFFIFSYIARNRRIVALIICSSMLLNPTINFIMKNFEFEEIARKDRKQILYIIDKFSLFYFSQNKIAVLPAQKVDLILPTYDNGMPKDLEDSTGEAYKDKVYEVPEYSEYLKIVYGIKNNPGFTFKDYDVALKEFKENGGELTNEELEELNFTKMENKIKQKE